MKSCRKELWLNVPSRRGFINMTRRVEECLAQSGIQEGLCLANAMHITASVHTDDDERGLLHDYEEWLEELVPHAPVSQYGHNRIGENACPYGQGLAVGKLGGRPPEAQRNANCCAS